MIFGRLRHVAATSGSKAALAPFAPGGLGMGAPIEKTRAWVASLRRHPPRRDAILGFIRVPFPNGPGEPLHCMPAAEAPVVGPPGHDQPPIRACDSAICVAQRAFSGREDSLLRSSGSVDRVTFGNRGGCRLPGGRPGARVLVRRRSEKRTWLPGGWQSFGQRGWVWGCS